VFISMHSVLRFYICISHFMYMPMILVNLIVFEREKGSESSKFYEIFLTQIFLTHCVLLLYIFYSIFVPFMYMPMTLNASEREREQVFGAWAASLEECGSRCFQQAIDARGERGATMGGWVGCGERQRDRETESESCKFVICVFDPSIFL
jgi:hypothetical protein